MSSCGRLDVIIGPMFSGKTTALITKIATLSIYKHVCIINSSLDTRCAGSISTHNHLYKNYGNFDILIAKKLNEIDVTKYDVVGVDESQMFPDLYDTVSNWIDEGKEVIVAGIDGDWRRKPIGRILDLIPKCRTVTKLLSICCICSKEGKCEQNAPYTLKMGGDSSAIVEIGGSDIYFPMCEKHYRENFHDENA